MNEEYEEMSTLPENGNGDDVCIGEGMGDEIMVYSGEVDGEEIKTGGWSGDSCGDITGDGDKDLHKSKRGGEVCEMGSSTGDGEGSHTGDEGGVNTGDGEGTGDECTETGDVECTGDGDCTRMGDYVACGEYGEAT